MAQISRKFDFLPGTKIYSNQIDDEFNQLVSESNAQDARLTDVEADQHSHTNKTVLDKITQSGTETSIDLSNFATKGEASSVTAHKSTHASGGSDALTPGDIGAVNKSGDEMSGDLTLSNNRAVMGKKSNGTTTPLIHLSTDNTIRIGDTSEVVRTFLGNQFWHTGNDNDLFLKTPRPSSGDLNDFLELNAFFTHDTGVSAISNTPEGTLALGSAKVFVVKNFGDQPGRLRQEFSYVYPLNDTRSWVRNREGTSWGAWKGVGGVTYKTYTTTVASTNLNLGAVFDINLVNVTGKGYVDVLVAFFNGIDLSKNDGVELIVDGQILWSQANSTSGSTNGALIDNSTPIIGFDYNTSYDTKFSRVYFNSSFRLRVFGTASSTNTGSYGVDRFSYHLEQ